MSLCEELQEIIDSLAAGPLKHRLQKWKDEHCKDGGGATTNDGGGGGSGPPPK